MGYAINPCAIFDFANQTTHTDTYTFDKNTYQNARNFSPAANSEYAKEYLKKNPAKPYVRNSAPKSRKAPRQATVCEKATPSAKSPRETAPPWQSSAAPERYQDHHETIRWPTSQAQITTAALNTAITQKS